MQDRTYDDNGLQFTERALPDPESTFWVFQIAIQILQVEGERVNTRLDNKGPNTVDMDAKRGPMQIATVKALRDRLNDWLAVKEPTIVLATEIPKSVH